MSVDAFHHRRGNLIWVIVLLTLLLGVFLFAVSFGPGFDPGSNDPVWAWGIGLALGLLIGVFGWVLLRNPRALVVSPDGLDLPFAFRRPLPWRDIHRIRRQTTRTFPHGKRDWLIIDPSPDVLAPLRLPTLRRLEIWFQRKHGIRIPLHGLAADPDDVVRSIERFRTVDARSDDIKGR